MRRWTRRELLSSALACKARRSHLSWHGEVVLSISSTVAMNQSPRQVFRTKENCTSDSSTATIHLCGRRGDLRQVRYGLFPYLRRWAGTEVERFQFATPFLYAVPHNSMLPPEAVLEHFCRVERCVRQLTKQDEVLALGSSYPGLNGDAHFKSLPEAVQDGQFTPETVAAVFATAEIAVDPASVAGIVRQAVAASPRIRFLPQAHVRSVE